jgi:hypothetical protein
MRNLFLTPRCSALTLAAALPFAQAWSDTGLISRDDDWSGVAGVVGYRGDGLTAAPGVDPRQVVADGSGTPVDVNADETDPLAVGLAAGVAEFELADPVVALQGSATASAPHLVISLDTRGRSGLTVRYRLRDVDPSSIANAVQPVALQYRVGDAGEFAAVPGGFVGDATTGPGQATLATPVTAVLPAAADDRPLVQVRVITTNANGQDEWVGIDDIEVEASGEACTPPAPPAPPGAPPPGTTPPSRSPSGTTPPSHTPPGSPQRPPPPQTRPARALTLTGLTLTPPAFAAAGRGPAVSRSGRAGATLAFRLSRPATVRFHVQRSAAARPPLAHADAADRELGRFSVRARRGLNRLRLSGRLRGRPLPAGRYRLLAQAITPDGQGSGPATVAFRIR